MNQPMKTPLERKSTIEDIRKRFDDDVERFSNLDTGQTATDDQTFLVNSKCASFKR